MSRRPSLPRPRWRRASTAYTVVEVLIAMSVLSIGTAGVLRMQQVSTRALSQARTIEVANGIAARWVERIRTDMTAIRQNLPAAGGNPELWTHGQGPLYDTKIQTNLKNMQAGVLKTFVPQASTYISTVSPKADFKGRDIPNSDTTTPTHYCTLIRLFCLQTLPNNANHCSLAEAEVRVIWAKWGSFDLNCSGDGPSPLAYEDRNQPTNKYGYVQLTTSIRRNTD